MALNGAGDICGFGYGTVPVVWPNGVDSSEAYTVLAYPPTPTFTDGYARHINAFGTIVGYATSGTTVQALRWEKSFGTTIWSAENLGAPAGGQAYAYAVTDAGRIAGKAMFTSGGPFHAFVTGAAPPTVNNPNIDVGTMGGTASEANDINDESGTAGTSQISSGYWRAFFLPIDCTTLGGFITYQIPALPGVTRTDYSSGAYGVNRTGQAVGYTQNQSLANRAFIYSAVTGIITDLNSYQLDGGQTPASLSWTLTSAASINDAGVIVGYGINPAGSSTCWIIYPKCQD